MIEYGKKVLLGHCASCDQEKYEAHVWLNESDSRRNNNETIAAAIDGWQAIKIQGSKMYSDSENNSVEYESRKYRETRLKEKWN